jgi:glutamate-1-semialdehyde aminotransferase
MDSLDDLIRAQEATFLERTPRSQAMWREACAVMPGGVTSSWASTRPIPVWIDHGRGSHVWDVDGN